MADEETEIKEKDELHYEVETGNWKLEKDVERGVYCEDQIMDKRKLKKRESKEREWGDEKLGVG